MRAHRPLITRAATVCSLSKVLGQLSEINAIIADRRLMADKILLGRTLRRPGRMLLLMLDDLPWGVSHSLMLARSRTYPLAPSLDCCPLTVLKGS
jgi:hypothetical protein